MSTPVTTNSPLMNDNDDVDDNTTASVDQVFKGPDKITVQSVQGTIQPESSTFQPSSTVTPGPNAVKSYQKNVSLVAEKNEDLDSVADQSNEGLFSPVGQKEIKEPLTDSLLATGKNSQPAPLLSSGYEDEDQEPLPDSSLPPGFTEVSQEPLPDSLLPPGYAKVAQEPLPDSLLPPEYAQVAQEPLPDSLLPPGFREVAEEPLPNSLLPPGYESRLPVKAKPSKLDKLKSSYAGGYRHTASKTDEVHVVNLDDGEDPKARTVSSGSFGAPGRKAAPSGDPLAELLKDIKILDIDEFLPTGYKFGMLEPELARPELSSYRYDPDTDINTILR